MNGRVEGKGGGWKVEGWMEELVGGGVEDERMKGWVVLP